MCVFCALLPAKNENAQENGSNSQNYFFSSFALKYYFLCDLTHFLCALTSFLCVITLDPRFMQDDLAESLFEAKKNTVSSCF